MLSTLVCIPCVWSWDSCLWGSTVGPWWDGPGLVLFVDGACHGPVWHIEGFSAQLGVWSVEASGPEKEIQQLVELHAVSWAVRLAVSLRYRVVTLLSDAEVAECQFLGAEGAEPGPDGLGGGVGLVGAFQIPAS